MKKVSKSMMLWARLHAPGYHVVGIAIACLLIAAPENQAAEVWLSANEPIDVKTPCEVRGGVCPKPIQRISFGNDVLLFSQEDDLYVGRSLVFEKKSRKFIEIPRYAFLSPDGKFLVAIDLGEFGNNGPEIRLLGFDKGSVTSLDSLKPEGWSPQIVSFANGRISISGYEWEGQKKVFFEYSKIKNRWVLVAVRQR